MTSKLFVCRLCMSTELLTDLYKVNDETSLKTVYCVDITMHPDDGLPSVICQLCEESINQFYSFKKRCLKVDVKLRAIRDKLLLIKPTSDIHLVDDKVNVKQESQNINTCENNLDETFDCWLSNNSKCNHKHESVKEKSDIFTEQCQLKVTKKNYHLKNDCKSKNMFQCEHCGLVFSKKTMLKAHLKLFSCKICSKRFTRAAHKVAHMRIHNGIKPYICEVCGKASTKRQDLIRHLRIHNDEKNYKCPRCDRRFKRSGDIHSHMRTHTGDRPYICITCNKTYTSHSGYSKHRKKGCKKEIS